MRRYLFDGAGMDQTAFATEGPLCRTHRASRDGPWTEPGRTPGGTRYGPAGANIISTVTDLLRFATLHLEDPSLAPLRAAHGEVAIHAWLEPGASVGRGSTGPAARSGGGTASSMASARCCKLIPEHHAAVVLLTNSSNGRAMYRSLFTELMHSAFGITVPTAALETD